ncbi:uncharacterized protein LOC126991294 isoform X2 [Eriocheir sinensis]|uniref:uncharacterized protein LOC126991294 isoform X2 n=1 Tax=Eriocheir sinensis TaxID=95602 RepID=UPI0021C5D094|nr:uncharacterized protein LOC126991294 isoform X2 [Eriocheir sinensis]
MWPSCSASRPRGRRSCRPFRRTTSLSTSTPPPMSVLCSRPAHCCRSWTRCLQAEPGPAWASSVPRPPRRAGPPPRPLLLQQRGRRRQQAGMPRVLVVDQDVHLGSGIQHLFVAEPRVLYVSLHCHHHGLFLPSSEDPNYDEWGRDLAKATTLTFAATRVAWVTQRLSLRWCCPWPTSSTHSWSWSLPALMLVRGPTLRLLRESRLL